MGTLRYLAVAVMLSVMVPAYAVKQPLLVPYDEPTRISVKIVNNPKADGNRLPVASQPSPGDEHQIAPGITTTTNATAGGQNLPTVVPFPPVVQGSSTPTPFIPIPQDFPAAGALAPAITIPPQGKKKHFSCSFVPSPGECQAAFPRYFYNETTSQCDCYFFGGCDEEVGSYRTLDECHTKCIPDKKEEGPSCQFVYVNVNPEPHNPVTTSPVTQNPTTVKPTTSAPLANGSPIRSPGHSVGRPVADSPPTRRPGGVGGFVPDHSGGIPPLIRPGAAGFLLPGPAPHPPAPSFPRRRRPFDPKAPVVFPTEADSNANSNVEGNIHPKRSVDYEYDEDDDSNF